MARRYSGKKGKSRSTKPAVKAKHIWIRYTPKEIESLIIKVAKTQKSPSQIGLILRDSYGIPDVKAITNKRITGILKENKLLTELPEDIASLIKKEISLLKHLEKNKRDMTAKRGMQLTESKINRLVKYYKRKNIIPNEWKFDKDNIQLLIK